MMSKFKEAFQKKIAEQKKTDGGTESGATSPKSQGVLGKKATQRTKKGGKGGAGKHKMSEEKDLDCNPSTGPQSPATHYGEGEENVSLDNPLDEFQ